MKILKVQVRPPAMIALAFLTILATAVMIWSCGRKGPPKPPTGSNPPSISDLTHSIKENTLKLSWTIPKPHAEARLPVVGFLIYRSQQPVLEKPCPNCPMLFKTVGDVPVRGSGSGQDPQAVITFTQTIEPGYSYTYKVLGYSADGIQSKTSNFVGFTH